nr:D-alanyl-D-alanine carboxypeptidase/D-alanyl-D-alanine-endopeptidase [Mesopusillimonas faecipullorum]
MGQVVTKAGKQSWQKHWQRFVVALTMTLLANMTWAQNLPEPLRQPWRQTRLQAADVSLLVKEVGGPTLISLNPEVPRNPASVMKLVTTWAGLSGLGPAYRWRTSLMARADAQIGADGTLQGPLYVKASGDPFFTVEQLWALLRELRLRGVKNLNEVVVDRSLFGKVEIDPEAFDASGDRPYNASPDAMMVGWGAVRVLFLPDEAARKWVPVVDPPVPGVRFDGEVAWSRGQCTGSPTAGIRLYSEGEQLRVALSGTAPGACGEFSVYRLAQSQGQHFETLFRMLWKELGGTLGRGFTEGRVPSRGRTLVWHDSVPLADVIRLINKQSNNVMARMLLLTLGAEVNGSGATASSGAKAAMALLRQQGVDLRGWQLENGSGLSREERLTASGLAAMLEAAWKSSSMPEYLSSLAISGVDGTMRRRLRDEEVRGAAHLKTGTLRDSRALAGYVLGASGKRYIVVSLANGQQSAGINPFHDTLIAWLASQ